MFSTKVDIKPSVHKIDYEDGIMTLGSCFAENIGKKLRECYFDVDINPFGVLYNPISILNSLNLLADNTYFTETNLFETRSLWQSFSHSSLFSDITADGCLQKINSRLSFSSDFFKHTNYLLITFGTAWVYEDVESKKVVSNCHKLPSGRFNRRCLAVDEIVLCYKSFIKEFERQFPQIKIIFSVSPIRHWKDGAHENNLSKSILLLAVNELVKSYDHVQYFPAYEIQMDELRDYRYYAADMLHPSEVAVDYIWTRFSDCYFSEQTIILKKQLSQLFAATMHRPLQPNSREYLLFLKDIEKRRSELIESYPFLKDRI